MSDSKNTSKRPQYVLKKSRRGSSVPTAMVIVLLILALLMGAVGGYFVARRTDPHLKELEELRSRSAYLENILTAIGFTVGEDDPDNWVIGDTSDESDALEDIASGDAANDEEDLGDLWNDESLLGGLLSEDQEDVVVAEFDGGQVMSSEVIPLYNEELSNLVFQGEDPDEVSGAVLQSVIADVVTDKLTAAEAKRLGLDALSEEDNAAIVAEAQAEYDTNLDFALTFVGDDSMTSEEIADAAMAYLSDEMNITVDSLIEEHRTALLKERYRAHVVGDVSATDEEVREHYDALLEEQTEDFTSLPDNFFFSHLYSSASPVVYHPKGFRAVRDILIAFDDPDDAEEAAELLEEMASMDVTDAERSETINQRLNELYAPLEATAAEAQEKLNNGADFADLMDEYGCSELLATEPLRSEGFYISSDTVLNSAEYVQGAMMLESEGDVSTPLRGAEGLYLVQYLGELDEGAVPFEDVKEAVAADVVAEKEEEAYEAHEAGLLDAANVKYYTERLQ